MIMSMWDHLFICEAVHLHCTRWPCFGSVNDNISKIDKIETMV